jgi:flagellar protein FlaJ
VILDKLRKRFFKHGEAEKKSSVVKPKVSFQPWAFAYRLLGERVDPVLPYFKDLEKSMRKAGMLISLHAYVSFLLFMTLVAFATSFSLAFIIGSIIYAPLGIMGVGVAFSLSLAVGLIVAVITFAGIYSSPWIIASGRRAKIDQSLPFVFSYMAILSSAGMSPERIYRSMARNPTLGVFAQEARIIIRDVDLLGHDILTAIDDAIERSPSPTYSEAFEGFIATVRAGGDLTKYLSTTALELMRTRRIRLKEFLDTLGMLAESEVAIFVAFPLILIIMLGIMSVLGGAFGPLSALAFMYIVVYLMVPLLAIMFILILEAVTPGE